MSRSLRQFFVLFLLLIGLQCWTVLGRADFGERRQMLALGVAIVLTLIPRVRKAILSAAERLRAPSPRARILTAIAIATISSVYLFATARFQHRDFAPIVHDEYVYLIQSKILATGHLWLPPHELGDFFDSFHLITDRVYASKYGPGAALAYAPAMMLHLPNGLTPLLLSGIAVGLLYLLATEVLDGGSGLLAALLLLSLGMFRRTSIMVLSQAPMLVLALLAMLAFVHWRRGRGAGWMVLLSAAAGWGIITRPVDGACVALPLAVAVLIELRDASARQRVRTILVALVATAPFLGLQALYNKGVTGRLTELPWTYYALRNDPYDTMGDKPLDTRLLPPDLLPQKQALIDEFTRPAFRTKLGQSRSDRVLDRASKLLAGPPSTEEEPGRRIYGALPSPLLIALLPLGLLAMTNRRYWMLWAPLPLFILIYANYSYFFPHYAVAMAPAIILMQLGGAAAIRSTWPGTGSILALAVIALSVSALPELNPTRRDQWFDAPFLRQVDRTLATIDRRPAIVLFKYDPERSVHEEPVYNVATAWPDDAQVIRAHDLGGDRDGELFAYYARRSPGRAVYRLDEKDGQLTYLGTAAELDHRATTQTLPRP